jgi:rubrerythrin
MGTGRYRTRVEGDPGPAPHALVKARDNTGATPMAQSFEELIDFAISQEEEAVAFYSEWAGKVADASVKQTLLDFAQQERGHKAKLEAVKKMGAVRTANPKAVKDLQISDYLVDVQPKPNMSFQEALILAMKKEKAAFRMYTELSERSESPELRDVFRFLAQEEASHKLGFELEYDDLVYQEN